MRRTFVLLAAAAMIAAPFAVASAVQAATHPALVSPGGPTFTCKPWASLPAGAKVIAITNTRVTYRNALNTENVHWMLGGDGGIVWKVVVKAPPANPVYLLTSEDIAANPNASVNSIHSGTGMFVRRSYAQADLNRLGIWTCTY